jgi:hypothetical protein
VRRDEKRADESSKVSVIKQYYSGCTAGDLDLQHFRLHPDVVHYFLAPNVGSKPVLDVPSSPLLQRGSNRR